MLHTEQLIPERNKLSDRIKSYVLRIGHVLPAESLIQGESWGFMTGGILFFSVDLPSRSSCSTSAALFCRRQQHTGMIPHVFTTITSANTH